MARPKVCIGTGEELEPYLKRQPKQRFRLIPISEESDFMDETGDAVEASEQKDATQGEKTLAEMFAGRVGRLSFEPTDLSQDTGKKFTELIIKKHQKEQR